jgi:D-3-phosphoglycerate dehydrogenase
VTRILLTHTPEARATYYGRRALAGLRELGEVRLHESAEPLREEALLAAARDCQVIVSDRDTPGPALVFRESPELVAFVRCAVDIRTIEVEAASASGVLVTRASPGFVASVTELVVGMMVDLARGVSAATAAYQAGAVPAGALGAQLSGSTLGVIGYGAIGSNLARVGQAFGMKVLAHDPYTQVDEPGVRQTSLEALLAESDFVVCLAVATDETENLLDAEAFARMKPTAYFVNPSRGNLVDETALRDVLERHAIAGVAMDVGRAQDQMPSPELARLPGVIATPHIGGLTPPAIEHQALETVEQVRAIVDGVAPPGAVNADRATRLSSVR